MRHTLILAAALAAAAAFTTSAEDVDDSGFLLDAIHSNLAEIRMSELAVQRADDTAVRDYASKLAADHMHALDEISALARKLGVAIPAEPEPAALERHGSLEKLSGPAFDAAFVDHMVAAHRAAVAKYGEHARSNPNEEVAELAAKTLPTLQQHLAAAEQLQTQAATSARPDPHLRQDPTSPSSRP